MFPIKYPKVNYVITWTLQCSCNNRDFSCHGFRLSYSWSSLSRTSLLPLPLKLLYCEVSLILHRIPLLCRVVQTKLGQSKSWSHGSVSIMEQTTDTQWRHNSQIYEKFGRCGRQNMLRPYLKIWDWIFSRALKTISSLGVRSPWCCSRTTDTRTGDCLH